MALKWHGPKVAAAYEQAARKGLARLAISFQGTMKQVVSKPGTGRTYKRPTRTHVASAPGRPPTVDTGSYRRSIQVDLSGLGSNPPSVRIGTNQKIGPMLEFGTRHMAARPHWRPTLRREGPKLIREFAAFMRRNTKLPK